MNSIDEQVGRYTATLERELRGLPRARRREIVADVRLHLTDAIRDHNARTPEDVAAVIHRFGTPAEVADAARAELHAVQPPTGPVGVREVITVVLLLIGGILLPVLGWLIGLVLLWSSDAWRVRDRLIGTLLVPGGLLPALALLVLPASTQTCSGNVSADGVLVSESCTTTGFAPPVIVVVLLLVVVVLGPLFTAFWLLRQARAAPARPSPTDLAYAA